MPWILQEKQQVDGKGRKIRSSSNFLTPTLYARTNGVTFKILKGKKT